MTICHLHSSFCLSQSPWAHILPTEPKEMPTQSNSESRGKAALSQGFFSAVSSLPSLYLCARDAPCSHWPCTIPNVLSYFWEHGNIAFVSDIVFKSRILILKTSESLFVVIPTGFASDLKQTRNALSFPFYPRSHGPLWIPGLFISFSK